MTTHWFFSLGVNPQPALYYRVGTLAPFAERRFVTTALLELGWPVAKADRGELCLHLLPTEDLRKPIAPSPGAPPPHQATSPEELFLQEIDAVAPGLRERLEPHAPLHKRDHDAIWRVVEIVLETVRDGDDVVLETTNGIRSIVNGFLLASGLLIAHRKQVRVLGVPYAELGAEDVPAGVTSKSVRRGSPVLDMRPFLGLFDWAHAVRAMSRYLDPTPTSALIEQAGVGQEARARLAELGAALTLNFPLEIERSLAAWTTLGALDAGTPAARLALRHIGGELASLVPPAAPADAEPVLEERRLDFDLALIERLAAAERHADAARAVREWLVNAVLLAWGQGDRWLDQAIRGRAEARLFGISDKAPAAAKALKALWLEAARNRNAVSHLRYNDKHDIDVATLRAFLSGVVARLRALRATTPSPFDLQGGAANRYLGNAFSLNMLARDSANVRVTHLTAAKAKAEADGRLSIVGHASTAALFAGILDREVAVQRLDAKLDQGDTLLVGQYSGERLPEGATTLPPGAKIAWKLVEIL